MDDVAAADMRQARQAMHDVGNGLGHRQYQPITDDLREALTFDELVDHKPQAVVDAEVINSNDVGMVDLGDRLGFTFKAFDKLTIFVKRFIENLDRYDAIEADLPALEHGAHAALANFLLEPIPTKRLTKVLIGFRGNYADGRPRIRGIILIDDRGDQPPRSRVFLSDDRTWRTEPGEPRKFG